MTEANPREMLLKKCWPASTISSAENWSVDGGCVGINGAGWMATGVGTVCAGQAPVRGQQPGERLQRAARHNPWNASPLTLAYTRRPHAHILSRRGKRTVILVDPRRYCSS